MSQGMLWRAAGCEKEKAASLPLNEDGEDRIAHFARAE